ncbi:cytochrome d ubiquinol oxidase subunit II [Conexibacter woesei]|uniref:Cytochrome d ubiquinol oxidase, subunit II n=1 Tax=Conexibacter woesei (strain DSM 14684 / CCUG 47730 / CIP 108061 / JCM 11494 / NBRC 100937 / ID131577) TaxID=469383 RepID=D3FD50_CONWI|nr:cytochrome d ubiquinol oxidase subunit II [Conexibacter woesei]ADB53442.1 cytochrome d ubiquinol oxidase, subunit II [Conexibacter woesei DSM 14684]
MADLTLLQSVWLVAIAVLWVLYLVLEGFDFGVGMLLRRVRRDQLDRRVALHAIGPTWAANEVWVIVAVVGMFGAFPGWYAAWASGLYLPLAVVLLSIVARNAGIELLGKREDERWRLRWERVIELSSTVAPFCWGLMWAATVHGLSLRGEEVVGSPLDVVTPYSVLGGLALVALCRAQGAAFLMLRTDGGVRSRAAGELALAAPVAAVVGIGFLAWTGAASTPGAAGWIALVSCGVALTLVALLARRGAGAGVDAGGAGAGGAGAGGAGAGGAGAGGAGAGGAGAGGAGAGGAGAGGAGAGAGGAGGRSGAAPFAAASAAIGLLVASWFCVLFPDAIAAAGGGAGLALTDVAAGSYTLTLMTVLAGLMVPLLLAAQAWTYWAFRHRITRADVGERQPSPVDLIARLTGGDRPGGPGAGGPAGGGATGGPGFHGPGFRPRGGPRTGGEAG